MSVYQSILIIISDQSIESKHKQDGFDVTQNQLIFTGLINFINEYFYLLNWNECSFTKQKTSFFESSSDPKRLLQCNQKSEISVKTSELSKYQTFCCLFFDGAEKIKHRWKI